jgi:hypothetical protein
MDRAEERFSVSDLANEIQPGTVQIEHTVDLEPVMRSLINAARHQDAAESLDLKEAARTLEDYLDCRQNTALHLTKTRLKTAGTCTDVDGQDTAASRAPVYKESVGMVRNAPERSLVSEGQACRTDNDPYCHCKPIRLLSENVSGSDLKATSVLPILPVEDSSTGETRYDVLGVERYRGPTGFPGRHGGESQHHSAPPTAIMRGISDQQNPSLS